MGRIFLAVALTVAAFTANAEIVATCGISEGRSYYIPGGLVTGKHAGWTDEKISKGSFQLIRSGDEYDIVFTDSTGRTLSSKGDGATTSGYRDDAGNLVVTVMYPGSLIETWVFWLSVKTERIATYSQARHNAPIRKHSLLKATCNW